MKKIIFSLSALAALLLAGSCQRENLEPVEQGGTVTYTVQVPGALATKADGDGFVAYYEVYRQGEVGDGKKSPIYKGSQPFENGSANIELEFVKDQNFTVLFWAQKDGAAYNTGNLRNVTLGTLTANQENYEVFAGMDEVSNCVSSNNGNVKLVRPIAQLNIATLTSGLTLGNTVSSSTVEPEFSDLKVTGLYSAYNVATGEVIGDAGEVSYVKSAIKANDIFNSDYTRVGMNYVGFMPEEGANVEVDFNIYTKKDGNISHKVSNVPVKPNYKTNIIGNLISATDNYQVTLEDWADAEITVANTIEAVQAALDSATDGDIIQLEPGVNYGTLKFRANPGHSNTTLDEIADAWSYNYNRSIKDITIIGAEGAKVDGFVFETGALPGDCNNRVTVNNLVIDGVEFTDAFTAATAGYNAPIMITTSNATIDGLTVKNCKLIGDNNKLNLVYLYGADGSKNVSLINNKVEGIARLCELRGTENVTLTGNVIKNTYEHAMLLAGGGYDGNVTITGNTADGIRDRFVRMAGAGDAAVLIKDNNIYNYKGADADYIKVTDGTNVTIENNTISVGAQDAASAQTALDNAVPGTVIQLEPGVNYGTLIFRKTASSTVVDITDAGGDAAGNEKYRRIEDLTIIGAEGAIVDGFDFQVGWISGSGASYIDIKNLTVKNVTFSGNTTPFNFEGSKGSALGIDGLNIVDCKMNDANNNNRFVFQQISGYKVLNDKTTTEYVMTAGIKNLTITGCEITGAYQVIESRAMENLAITNNTFRGIKARDMLITSDVTYHPNTTYTGNVTVTGNQSFDGEERFVRASLNNSDAVVVIKDNRISNYCGSDYDFIKVDGANNLTLTNNTFVASTSHELTRFILNATDGAIFELAEGNHGALDFTHTYNGGKINAKNITIQGVEGTVVSNLVSPDGGNQIINWTIKGIKFDGTGVDQKGIDIRSGGNGLNVENCKFINGANIYVNNDYKDITIKKCDFEQSTTGGVYCQKVKNVAIDECQFVNMPYNAIQLSGAGVSGDVSITKNTIRNCVSRAMRLVTVDGATLNICNNTMTNSNNASDNNVSDCGQVIKITGAVLTGNFDNNTHDGDPINFNGGIAR